MMIDLCSTLKNISPHKMMSGGNFTVCFGHVSLCCASRHVSNRLSLRSASEVGQVLRSVICSVINDIQFQRIYRFIFETSLCQWFCLRYSKLLIMYQFPISYPFSCFDAIEQQKNTQIKELLRLIP